MVIFVTLGNFSRCKNFRVACALHTIGNAIPTVGREEPVVKNVINRSPKRRKKSLNRNPVLFFNERECFSSEFLESMLGKRKIARGRPSPGQLNARMLRLERIMTYSFSRKRWVYPTDAILFKIKNLVVSRTNQEATTFKRSESNKGRRKNNGTDDREGKQKDFDNDRPDSIS